MRRALLRLRTRGRLTAARDVRVGRGVHVSTARGGRIHLGPAVTLGDGCRLEATAATIAIRGGALVGERAVLLAHRGIDVGEAARIGDWATLDDTAADGVPGRGTPAPIRIGAGAHLGPHAVAGPGVLVAPGEQIRAYAVRSAGTD